MDCQFDYGYGEKGNGSAGFTIAEHDQNVAATTYSGTVPSTTSTSASVSMATSAVVTITPSAQASPVISSASTSGLSVGAAAGIGVSSTVAGLLIVGLLGHLFMIRYKKRRGLSHAIASAKSSESDTSREMTRESYVGWGNKPEMSNDGLRSEIDGTVSIGELHEDVVSHKYNEQRSRAELY